MPERGDVSIRSRNGTRIGPEDEWEATTPASSSAARWNRSATAPSAPPLLRGGAALPHPGRGGRNGQPCARRAYRLLAQPPDGGDAMACFPTHPDWSRPSGGSRHIASPPAYYDERGRLAQAPRAKPRRARTPTTAPARAEMGTVRAALATWRPRRWRYRWHQPREVRPPLNEHPTTSLPRSVPAPSRRWRSCCPTCRPTPSPASRWSRRATPRMATWPPTPRMVVAKAGPPAAARSSPPPWPSAWRRCPRSPRPPPPAPASSTSACAKTFSAPSCR